MKYLIDLSCQTDVLLFKGLKRKLEEHGHQVFVTTRHFMDIEALAVKHGMRPHQIGWHGDDLYMKLKAGAERIRGLADYIYNDIGMDLAVISNSNPEICRVGYGLGLKVFSWNDSPDLQVAQTKLTAPLSDWIFTPWVVPKRCFEYMGVPHDRVFQYGALFPMAWLPEVEVNQSILGDLALERGDTLVTFRESETKSAYLSRRDLAVSAVKALAQKYPRWQFVTHPRYSVQDLYRKMGWVPDNVHVFAEPIDTHSLLAMSDLFISGGGTMTIEAAYYGTPCISTREKTTYYDHFLIQEKLAERAETVEGAVELAERLMGVPSAGLEEPEDPFLKRTREVFSKMKYPLDEIVSILEGEHG